MKPFTFQTTADRPHNPGEAAKQWLKDLYQDNKLVKSELKLGGRTVDLKNLTMPVLNVFAKDDHIIPAATTQALRVCVGSKDYQPGTGEINYSFLFEALDREGYAGWIGCEYKPKAATSAGLGWVAPYLRA